MHWVDRGQYTAIVKKQVKGAFKSPPPYRDYPYSEEDAVTRIGLTGSVLTHQTWCRQINASKDIYHLLNGKVETEEPIKLVHHQETVAGRLLWDSGDTLKINNSSVTSGTYANDETNTILFASAIDADKQKAFFGVNNGDAIWTGIDSRWYINHHIIDSEVVNSTIEFNLLMGAADEIRVQLGNRSATGWILDNDYAFGGYEFIINRDGKIYSRIEYFYEINEAGRKTSAYSMADKIGDLKEFDPRKDVHVMVQIKNKGDSVVGMINIGRAFQKIWKAKDWMINESEIPKGRVDSKQLLSLYQGVKHHWSIGRVLVGNQDTDNGSLINQIKVYKL